MIDQHTVSVVIPVPTGFAALPCTQAVAGRALLEHTIAAAQAAERVDRVTVLSDDAAIGAIARASRAELAPISVNIQRLGLTQARLIDDLLDHVRHADERPADVLLCIEPTAALLTGSAIDRAMQAMSEENASQLMAVLACDDRVLHGDATPAQAMYRDARALYAVRRADHNLPAEAGAGDASTPLLHELDLDDYLPLEQPADLEVIDARLRARQHEHRLAALPEPIEAVIFDFDGVFTDNRVYVFQDAREAVAANRSDGLGLSRFSKLEIPMLVLSAEQNPVVKARADKLGIPCLHGFHDKRPALEQWCAQHSIEPQHAIFIGNDVNDVPCMQAVGCGVAPADAQPGALRAADIVLQRRGGEGAVRELIELILHRLGRSEIL